MKVRKNLRSRDSLSTKVTKASTKMQVWVKTVTVLRAQ